MSAIDVKIETAIRLLTEALIEAATPAPAPPAPAEPPALLTLAEAQDHLSLSRSSILKLVAAGKVPYVRPFGRALRFSRVALDEWIASRVVT